MKTYLLGIDNGGTVIKASLYDEKGKEIAVSGKKTELIVPLPGHIERDMDTLWEANYSAVNEVLAKSGIDAASIAGVAVTGHGNGLYMVDSDGRPVMNGILSADTRANEFVEGWYKDGTAEKVLSSTCQAIWAGQPVAILSWLKKYEPSVLNQVKWIFMCKDYIRFKLTGDAYAEITDYSGTNMMNVKTLEYDEKVLSEFGLYDIYDKLPPLKGSTQQCGFVNKEAAELTGLREGTPVFGGLFDIDASAIGIGITRPDLLCLVAGTWSINEFISPEPIESDSLFMCSAYCIPGYWLITEGSPTSASNLEWFVSQLMPQCEEGVSPYTQCDELVAKLSPDESDVLFLPFLYGSNVGQNASSAFLGMKGWHTKEHLIRAVFEGIVFSHMTHFERLQKHQKNFSAARIAGGAARSDVWVQMFSDALQLPIEVMENKELGALGAAMAAGVGAGIFSSFDEASSEMVRISRTYQPDIARGKIYNIKFKKYCSVIEALKVFWE